MRRCFRRRSSCSSPAAWVGRYGSCAFTPGRSGGSASIRRTARRLVAEDPFASRISATSRTKRSSRLRRARSTRSSCGCCVRRRRPRTRALRVRAGRSCATASRIPRCWATSGVTCAKRSRTNSRLTPRSRGIRSFGTAAGWMATIGRWTRCCVVLSARLTPRRLKERALPEYLYDAPIPTMYWQGDTMGERPGRVVTNFFRGDRVRRHGSGQVGAVEAQTADGTVSVRFDGSEAGAPCVPADLLLLASGPLPDGVLGPLADIRGSVLGGMADWDMVSATLLFRGYHAADAWLRARPDRYEDVLAQLDQARDAGKRLPVGYWSRGEDRWTAREAEDGRAS